jgi:hypothetical protein
VRKLRIMNGIKIEIAGWSVNPGEKRESLGLISNITNELASNPVVKDRELQLLAPFKISKKGREGFEGSVLSA